MKWPLPRWEGEGWCWALGEDRWAEEPAGGKEETVTLRKRKVVLLHGEKRVCLQ